MPVPYLESFIESLLVEKNATQNTVDSYSRDLKRFCSETGIISVADITQLKIQEYLRSLYEQKISAGSRARHLSSIKQYCKFLQREDIIEENPSLGVDTPQKAKALPKILSEEEIEKLLLAINEESPESTRLCAMLELMYAAGLRVSELVSLPLKCIIGCDSILIKGKGRKERLLPIHSTAIAALNKYIAIRTHFLPPHNQENPYLFPSNSQLGHLTRQRFGQLLKEVAIKAGVSPSKVSPHVLRHAFATHMLNSGADLLVVQKMLGHSDISTTEIYTHVQADKLKHVVSACHPLSKLAQES